MPAVKNVGEPCAGEPHARFDGGREETSASRPARAAPGASRLPDQPQWALNEAYRHGRGGVRVLFALEGGRLILRVGNRPRPLPQRRKGMAGEGQRELRALASRFADGRIESRSLAAPEEVGIRTGPEWYVVRVSWSAAGLDYSP
jgi:hypothetical protein